MSSDGTVYVFDAGNNRVVVFDASGAEIGGWGGQGSGEGQFDSLGFGGLAVGADDTVYVVDNGNHRVQKFAADGSFLVAWGDEGDGEGAFRRAIGIAVDADEVYVTDDALTVIQVFDTDGAFLRQFGDDTRLVHPTGIAVDGSGDVWVADFEAAQVQRFGPDGTARGVWRNPTDLGLFQIPEGIAIDGDGTVLVTSYRDGQIQILPDRAGDTEPWVVAGGEPGFGDGKLLAPVDVAIAPDGAVYVSDQRSNSVQRFLRD